MKQRSGYRTWPIAVICIAIAACILERATSQTPAQEQGPPDAENSNRVYDRSLPGLRSAAILIPTQEFTLQSLKQIARHFVESTHDATFAELLIGSDENELKVSEYGTVPRPESLPSFCDTLEQLRRQSGPVGIPVKPIARVFLMENNALLSYRKAGVGEVGQPGVEETTVAGDHDPTQVTVGTRNYRLLQFSVKRWNAERPLALFFKSRDEPSCSACRELAFRFQRRVNSHSLEVNIRRDTWFASDYFPLMFRFEPDNIEIVYSDWKDQIVPPKVSQYYRVSHVRCDLYSQEFSCDAYGRYEHVP